MANDVKDLCDGAVDEPVSGEQALRDLTSGGIAFNGDETEVTDALCRTDDFRMFCFKVLPCKKPYQHHWTGCPFAHPGEHASRRDPRTHKYNALVCLDLLQTGRCPKGDECTSAHSVFEYWLHPQRFKSQLCQQGSNCNRHCCFFAHKPEELRPVTVPADAVAAAAAAAAAGSGAEALEALQLQALGKYSMAAVPGAARKQARQGSSSSISGGGSNGSQTRNGSNSARSGSGSSSGCGGAGVSTGSSNRASLQQLQAGGNSSSGGSIRMLPPRAPAAADAAPAAAMCSPGSSNTSLGKSLSSPSQFLVQMLQQQQQQYSSCIADSANSLQDFPAQATFACCSPASSNCSATAGLLMQLSLDSCSSTASASGGSSGQLPKLAVQDHVAGAAVQTSSAVREQQQQQQLLQLQLVAPDALSLNPAGPHPPSAAAGVSSGTMLAVVGPAQQQQQQQLCSLQGLSAISATCVLPAGQPDYNAAPLPNSVGHQAMFLGSGNARSSSSGGGVGGSSYSSAQYAAPLMPSPANAQQQQQQLISLTSPAAAAYMVHTPQQQQQQQQMFAGQQGTLLQLGQVAGALQQQQQQQLLDSSGAGCTALESAVHAQVRANQLQATAAAAAADIQLHAYIAALTSADTSSGGGAAASSFSNLTGLPGAQGCVPVSMQGCSNPTALSGVQGYFPASVQGCSSLPASSGMVMATEVAGLQLAGQLPAGSAAAAGYAYMPGQQQQQQQQRQHSGPLQLVVLSPQTPEQQQLMQQLGVLQQPQQQVFTQAPQQQQQLIMLVDDSSMQQLAATPTSQPLVGNAAGNGRLSSSGSMFVHDGSSGAYMLCNVVGLPTPSNNSPPLQQPPWQQ